jgi:3-hydroxybutyryl-CoA dehydratase
MRSSLSSSREAQRGKTRNDATAKKRFQSNSANEKDGAKRALVLSKTRTFAREDVEQFAKITGDSNPIHVSRTATTDDNNIVHGALLVSMFPAIVGSTFPGAKYLRQTAMFRNECPVGARVTATVRKVKETRGGKIVEFETKVRCAEDEGKVYVDGFALAKIE